MHKRTIVIAGMLAGALALTGCSSSPEPTSSPSNVPTTAAPTGSSSTDAAAYTVSSEMGVKPTIEIAASAGNVDQLIVEDIVEGTGAAAQATDNVTVHYVGIGGESHQQFEASWDAGQTASFPLNGVIVGWQEGLLGMKVGGRRLLVIPGSMAYGATPPDGSGIGVNETLVFIVDLISIP